MNYMVLFTEVQNTLGDHSKEYHTKTAHTTAKTTRENEFADTKSCNRSGKSTILYHRENLKLSNYYFL